MSDVSQTQSSDDGERKFLHDLSNSVAIAQGLIDVVIDEAQGTASLSETQLARLKKSLSALQKIKEIVKARRSQLQSHT